MTLLYSLLSLPGKILNFFLAHRVRSLKSEFDALREQLMELDQ